MFDQGQVDTLLERRARKRAKRRRAQMRAAQQVVLRMRAVFVNARDAGWPHDEAVALQKAFVEAMQAGDMDQAHAIEHLSTLKPEEALAAVKAYDEAVAADAAAAEPSPIVEVSPEPEALETPSTVSDISELSGAPHSSDDDDDPFTEWVDNPESHASGEVEPAVVTEPADVASDGPVEVASEIEASAISPSEPETQPVVEKPKRGRRKRKSA